MTERTGSMRIERGEGRAGCSMDARSHAGRSVRSIERKLCFLHIFTVIKDASVDIMSESLSSRQKCTPIITLSVCKAHHSS